MTAPHIAGIVPLPVEVKAGQTYFWCSCGQSKNQPFCDGSHNGTDFTPLGWTADEEVVSHIIYFGTSETPDSIAYQRSPSFSPENIEANTTYYWSIDEENGSGVTEGPVWSFTTGSENSSDYIVLDYCDSDGGWNSSNGRQYELVSTKSAEIAYNRGSHQQFSS